MAFEVMCAEATINIPNQDFSISSCCCQQASRPMASYAHYRTIVALPIYILVQKLALPGNNHASHITHFVTYNSSISTLPLGRFHCNKTMQWKKTTRNLRRSTLNTQ